jgi:hypothetical protein
MKKLLWLSLFALLFAGCLERKLPTASGGDDSIALQGKSIPAIINPGRSYLVMVQVIAASDALPQTVHLDIYKENSTEKLLSLLLYDDGNSSATNNGDVVAFDGIYSQRLTWPAAYQQAMNLSFQFSVTSAAPLKIAVASQDGKPPTIQGVTCPDTLHSGFSGQQKIAVTVGDASGLQDIWGVVMTGWQNGAQVFGDTLFDNSATGVCSVALNNTWSAAKSGTYELQFLAVDKSGLTSALVKKNMYVVNGAPAFGEILLAKEVQRPLTGTVTILIQAAVLDPQGLGDIKQVKLTWKKPDNSYPTASPYTLYDNGLPYDLSQWNLGYRGDLVANDGVFSITGVFDSGNLLGDYTLGFQVEDMVGNKSVQVFHIVTLKTN